MAVSAPYRDASRLETPCPDPPPSRNARRHEMKRDDLDKHRSYKNQSCCIIPGEGEGGGVEGREWRDSARELRRTHREPEVVNMLKEGCRLVRWPAARLAHERVQE